VIDAIFVPRGVEERVVRRGLGRHAVIVRPTSAGASAANAVAAALEPGAKRVLIAGLCGSLDPAFAAGDVLIYGSIESGSGERIETDRALSAQLQQRIPAAQSGVRGFDVDHVVSSATEKGKIAEATGAQAIDMESYALAARLAAAGRTFTVLRCVSDGARSDLPDLTAAFGADGIDGRRLFGAMLSHPIAAAALIAGAMRGLRSLRRALHRLRP
jgi:nucleoside phosphorylase